MADEPIDLKTWTRKDGTESRQRPPFEEGNRLAVRHGVNSLEMIQEEARRVQGALAEKMPLLGLEPFGPAFEGLCREQALLNLCDSYIFAVIGGSQEAYPVRGRPRTGIEAVPDRIWKARDNAARNAQKFRQGCGLDPESFARMAKELGWASHLSGGRVQELVSAGRALRRGDQ